MAISRINRKATLVFGALIVFGALTVTAGKPAFAANALSASPGVISLGESIELTQTLDSPATGTVTDFKVTEPDGDVCKAAGGPTPLTRTYPDDFSLSAQGGDGNCDTNTVGMYNAETEVSTTVGSVHYNAEFETNFFVIPESPIGIAALMGSSLAALGGYMGLRRIRASATV